MERGLVCIIGVFFIIYGGIISVEKIGYYKGLVNFKVKFYIILGYEIVMGKVLFFGFYE